MLEAMAVLLLGATGFLGAWTARSLSAATTTSGTQVIALVRPSSSTWRIDGIPGVRVVRASEAEWPDEVERAAADTVLSLDWAGVAGSARDDGSQWSNLERMTAVAAAAARSGAERFVGIGSQAEYGPHDQTLTEGAHTAPVTEYGKAKLEASRQTRAVCEAAGVTWVWGRVFSTFGPLDHGHWLLPQIATALLEGRDIELSSGEQRWSYLYGADAGAALAALATAPGASGIVNVGHPDAPRLRDTIEEFARHLPHGGRLLFGAIPMGPTSVTRLEPDTSRLEALGWRPRVARDEALAETARWLSGAEVADPARPGSALPAPR